MSQEQFSPEIKREESEIPEGKISALAERLGLSHLERKWVRSVEKASVRSFKKYENILAALYKEKTFGNLLGEWEKSDPEHRLKEYETIPFTKLVEVHLRMQLDEREHPGFISHSTEKLLDEILTIIDMKFSNIAESRNFGRFEQQVVGWRNRLGILIEQNAQKKAEMLGLALGIFHAGGQNPALDIFVPSGTNLYSGEYNVRDMNALVLEALNNLGNAEYWKKHKYLIDYLTV